VDLAQDWPAEALANPFVKPEAVVAALAGRRAPGKKRTAKRRRKSGVWTREERERWRRLDAAYQLGALQRGRTEAGEPTPLPTCFEDFLKLVEGAFGGAPEAVASGPAGREQVTSAHPGENGNPSSGHARAGGDPSGHSGESGNPPGEREAPDCAAEIRELAEALWERLQVFRVEGEREREEVRQRVEEYLARFDPSSGEGPSPRVTLHGLVKLFQKGEKAFKRADNLNYRVELALYALLLKRYGPREEWEDFKPPRPADNSSNLLVLAILANSHGDVKTADECVAEYRLREAEYDANLKRWKELVALARGEPG
jgi:hypothetical protein